MSRWNNVRCKGPFDCAARFASETRGYAQDDKNLGWELKANIS